MSDPEDSLRSMSGVRVNSVPDTKKESMDDKEGDSEGGGNHKSRKHYKRHSKLGIINTAGTNKAGTTGSIAKNTTRTKNQRTIERAVLAHVHIQHLHHPNPNDRKGRSRSRSRSYSVSRSRFRSPERRSHSRPHLKKKSHKHHRRRYRHDHSRSRSRDGGSPRKSSKFTNVEEARAIMKRSEQLRREGQLGQLAYSITVRFLC